MGSLVEFAPGLVSEKTLSGPALSLSLVSQSPEKCQSPEEGHGIGRKGREDTQDTLSPEASSVH